MSRALGIMLGIVFFSMIVVGSNFFLNDFKKNYDIEIEEGWTEEFDFIENMTTISDDISNIVETNKTNWATGGFRLGYSGLKSILQVPKFISALFEGLNERLNLPPWATQYMVVIMMMVFLLTIVLPALLRWWL